MIAIALLGGILVGLAVLFALRAYSLPATGATGSLEQIEVYGYHAAPVPEPGAGSHRPAFGGLARSAGQWLIDRSPRIREDEVQRDLRQAGIYNVPAAVFTGYRIGAALLAGAAVLLLGIAAGKSTGFIVFLMVLAVPAGFILPRAILKRRIETRYEEIDRQLPDLVDILVVTVESGLTLSRSLQVASERITAPLGGELRLTLQEQEMGRGTNEALQAMLERCDTASMRSFVRSVTQGETLGVSIGEIMRNLAHEMRTRRRQAAETRAHKAPVKILFPLILLIFPALFLVLLYPAVDAFLNNLGA